MRTTSTLLFIIVIVLSLIGLSAHAKTSKYSRPGTTDPGQATGKAGATPSPSPTPGKDAGADAGKTEKKVDLSDLESRYWTAKDTEFSVVQNRLYTKAKKFSITPSVGPLLTDSYSNAYNFGLAINYYLTERTGVELQGWKTSASPADLVGAIEAKGTDPDHNIPMGYIGASYNWIPIYAKLALLDKKILYFDMSLSPGLGVTFMQADTFAAGAFPAPPATNQGDLTVALDVAQQVFLNEHWAIRADLRNHFYQESVYSASNATGTANVVRTKFTYYGTFMLGVTFFQ